MTSNSKALIVVAVLIVFGALVFFLSSEDTNETVVDTSSPALTTAETSPINETEEVQTFTISEVAVHNSESDCWTTINGSVYDITSYVPRHPGGDEILLACGTDGTSLFTQRQTTEGEQIGSGTPHSSNATSQLTSFQIGVLIQ